jgi:hypothetical protein
MDSARTLDKLAHGGSSAAAYRRGLLPAGSAWQGFGCGRPIDLFLYVLLSNENVKWRQTLRGVALPTAKQQRIEDTATKMAEVQRRARPSTE